jgi:hypothetical protein
MHKRIWSYALVVIMTVALSEAFHPLALVKTSAQGGCQAFPETGKQVCGRFLEYWQKNGGLAQQGLPLSYEFTEVSDLNGKSYTVQYFERAVFEKHPENAAPYDVLLSQLGTFQFKRKYTNGDPSGAGSPPAPTPRPAATTPPTVAGAKVDLVDYTTYKPKYGGRRAVGYLKNNGSADASRVEIIATFKDGAGKIVGTSGDDCYCLLRPGDFFPFSVGQSSSDPEFVSVEFQVVYQTATARDKTYYYNEFQVNDVNVVPPAGYTGLKVLGTVKNSGSGTAAGVMILVLITDQAGKTIDVESAYSRLDSMPPGATSPFEVELDNATQAPVVKVAVYGRTD